MPDGLIERGGSRLRRKLQLEVMVQERTERIRELERQRSQQEKLAAAGRLAARIAHEINNPLGGIKNSFLLVKDAVAEDHPYFDYVARIDREIERIAMIVRQTLDLYRPGQDSCRRFALGETIADVAAMIEAGEAGDVGLELVVAPGLPVRYLVMQQGGVKHLVYYWYLQRGRWLTSEYWNKLLLSYDSLTKRRADGALIRLITPTNPGVNLARERLTSFAKLIAPVLPQFINK